MSLTGKGRGLSSWFSKPSLKKRAFGFAFAISPGQGDSAELGRIVASDYFGLGGQNNPVATFGSVTLSGTAAASVTSAPAVDGGITASGTADWLLVDVEDVGGIGSFSGSADVSTLFVAAVDGQIATLSGSASYEYIDITAPTSVLGYGPVRTANSYQGQQPKSEVIDSRRVADVLRVVPKYKAPIVKPNTFEPRLSTLVLLSGTGTAITSRKQAKRITGPELSVVGNVMPSKNIITKPFRKSGFSGSAQVSFTADFTDDDYEAVAQWLLQAG